MTDYQSESRTGGARPKPVKVVMGWEIWELMFRLGKSRPEEVGGLLSVEDQGFEEGRLRLEVTELHVLPNTTTQRTTVGWEVEDEVAWLKKHGHWPTKDNPMPRTVWGKWHTHPGMGVFWSGTDWDSFVHNSIGPGLLLNVVIDPTKESNNVLARVDHRVTMPGWKPGEYLWMADYDCEVYTTERPQDAFDERVKELSKCFVKPAPVVAPVGYDWGKSGKYNANWWRGVQEQAERFLPAHYRKEPVIQPTKKGKEAKGEGLNKKQQALLRKLNELSKWSAGPDDCFKLVFRPTQVEVERGAYKLSMSPESRVAQVWFKAHFDAQLKNFLPGPERKAPVVCRLKSRLLEEVLDGQKQVP